MQIFVNPRRAKRSATGRERRRPPLTTAVLLILLAVSVFPGHGFMPAVCTAKSAVEKQRRFLDVPVGRVRNTPSLKSEILFKLQYGAEVAVEERRDDWYRVRTLDGRSGWSHSRLFTSTPPANAALHKTPVNIGRIWVEQPAADTQAVFVALDGMNTPHTFVVSGEAPRIVCDFYNARLAGEDLAKDVAEGRILRSIRTAAYGGPLPKVRLVVDLTAGAAVEIDPVFYKKDMRFSLLLSRGAPAD